MVGFERYEIIRQLTDGEITQTFVARRVDRDERVALKIFDARKRPKALIARLMGQLEACQKVRDPLLVKHLEVGRSSDGRPFLVTQWLDGEDLSQRLRRSGPLSAAELIQLILPLCELLEHLRDQGFYYPELRACDVLLPSGSSQGVLLDAARAWLADCSVLRAPECEPNAVGNARSDVFALGVLMYEALAGRPPFLDDAADPWSRKEHFSFSSLEQTSVALGRIVDRCLARNPRDRFESPSELARALAQGVGDAAAPAPPSNDAADGLQLGDCLGSYRLEKRLGAGSMGRVFLARHVRLGRTAAIKVLRRDYAQNPQFIERFFQEAKAVNRVNHEHIVEILDFVDEAAPEGRRVYCVMEMLTGASLAELIAREPLSIARALNIARQLCAGLEAAHQLGVVHRDIKPDNIFVTERQGAPDYVKILDFGVAKVLSPTGSAGPERTLEGVIVGTPAYMAPEQAAGFAADARSDIYSVGAVLYEMLAGRVPFAGATLGQLMAKVIAQSAPALGVRSRCGEDIPPELSALVRSCLEKDPKRRPQSMDQLGRALGELSWNASSKRRRLWSSTPVRVGAAAAGLILLAASLRFTDGSSADAPAPPPRRSEVAAAQMREGAPQSSVVNVKIASKPSGARVVRADSGAQLGFTPLAKPFSAAERDVVLRLELPGHRPIERTIQPSELSSLEVSLPPLRREKRLPAARGFGDKIGRDGLINPYD